MWTRPDSSSVKEDVMYKTISTIDAVQNRTMTLEYEFKGVKARGTEDLHNEWKYNHMISDELTTTENAKISLKSARVAHLTEKNGRLEEDISASKPKLHESRGEEANADREKLQAER